MPDEKPPQPLISSDDIARRIDGLAGEIIADLGRDFVMVIVLKGAFVFGADLLRAFGRCGASPRVEFLGLSSYGMLRNTSGRVSAWTPVPAVAGAKVLVVEDILDTGLSASYAKAVLWSAGAVDVRLCVLLDKQVQREAQISADHVGFTIPDRFVVGYGIDYAERWRELVDVAAVD